MAKLAIGIGLLLLLSGCSVAALVQADSLDKRLQTLEARVHDLEMHQANAQSAPSGAVLPK